jgi:integrase
MATHWKPTKTQFLYQNTDSGVFYARLYRDGRQIWKSLKTQLYSVAQARLVDERKTVRRAARIAETVESGKATVEAVAETYLDAERRRIDIKPATLKYRQRMVRSILKTWPELAALTPKQVTESMCKEWAAQYSQEYSGTQFNNGVDTLRAIFDSAVKSGMIFRNPVDRDEIGKRKPSQKRLQLPTRAEFEQVVREVRESGFPFAALAGDTVEFLAYSGCRIEEARNIKWNDVSDTSIWVHGDEETGTKGGESRQIPVITPMRQLLAKMQSQPLYREDREDYVLQVQECLESLEHACERAGIPKLTHHDLRHVFATRCIESGVDIPTVSRWLGHKDGGALAMKTYGHLRDEHSQMMAAKVRF